MNDIINAAIRLLARREHGVWELTIKLSQKGYDKKLIAEALAECQHRGLQSDSRFAESLCRQRVQQGYGPLRIRQELHAQHLDKELIDKTLNQAETDWLQCAQKVYTKKFKQSKNLTFAESQKQQRFLQYRGFPMDVIDQLFL